MLSPLPSSLSAASLSNPSLTTTVLGHVCIDENVVDDRASVAAGSPAVYVHRQFRGRPDVEVAIISPYGRDFLPYADGLPLVGGPTADDTLLYRNIVEAGHRTQQCRNVASATPAALDDEAIAVLRRTDILMLAPLVPGHDAAIVQQARRHLPSDAVVVLLAQGYLRSIGPAGAVGKRRFDDYADVLPMVDLVVLSDEDADDAIATASTWTHDIPAVSVVVTQNRRGATLVTEHGATAFPADPIAGDRVLDGIGAGDVFSAELALRFRRTRDLADAVGVANSAAAAFLLHGDPVREFSGAHSGGDDTRPQ